MKIQHIQNQFLQTVSLNPSFLVQFPLQCTGQSQNEIKIVKQKNIAS